MCWVDWIHDTQIWIETPFCKYHQKETKMCNGCSTVTCQCKPQRIPKVGEVWCWRENPTKCTAIIKLIDSEYAFFERNFHGVKSAGAYTLQQFLAWYDPPKPKPREWLTALDTDGSSASVLYPLDSPLTRYKGVYQIIKVREVLD